MPEDCPAVWWRGGADDLPSARSRPAVTPHAADQVLAAYRQEGFRLVLGVTAMGVELVGSALRGGDLSPQALKGRAA